MSLNVYQEEGNRADSNFYHIGDGYFYHVNSVRDNAISFRCIRSSCHGRATWIFYQGFTHTIGHCHNSDLLFLEVLAARRSIIDQARSPTYVSFANIIATERARLENRNVRSQLTLRRLRPAMQRARGGIFPNLPEHLAELSIILQNPECWELTKTLDGEDSMYLGSSWSEDGSHNIIFMSQRCLQIMRLSPIIFADGTFFVKPSVDGCYQVFTIVTIYENTVISLCWCLMERKSKVAYVSVLEFLRAQLGWWTFNQVVCDFEDAMISAFELVFQVTVQGCFFHSVNDMSMWARSNIGMPFIQFLELQIVIKLCCTIALLPHDLMQRGMNVIGRFALTFHPMWYQIIRPFLCYVQTEWLEHANRGATLSVCGSSHRTNNASESNNSRMKRKFGSPHPNTYHFIRELANFEDSVIDDMFSLSMGLIPTRHRSVTSISNDRNIQRLTAQLLDHPPTDEDIVQFLFGASNAVESLVQKNLHM